MKNNIFQLGLGLVICLTLISCDKSDQALNQDTAFTIEFSDGTVITENNLLYYDSSTHLLYLKENLIYNQTPTDFTVFVDQEIMYQGIIYSSYLSSFPPQPLYILEPGLYGDNIIQIGCIDDQADKRNDSRILNALEKNGLLVHGLSCTIDSLRVTSFSDYSRVTCSVTVTNNDGVNYYILAPEKMGELNFTCYMGGVKLINEETNLRYSFRWSVSNPDYANLALNDFLLLEKNGKASFTFQSSDYSKLEAGTYRAQFRFEGVWPGTIAFELKQNSGRVWVGDISAQKEHLAVD